MSKCACDECLTESTKKRKDKAITNLAGVAATMLECYDEGTSPEELMTYLHTAVREAVADYKREFHQ